MRCTEVADRPVPDGEFFGRDIGDRGRSATREMPELLTELDDLGDRFEGTWLIDSIAVTVSVDKRDVAKDTETLLEYLRERLRETLATSLHYFDAKKSDYDVAYIDDLSDPQIILGTGMYSVLWWSDKGEPQGECVVGIDFNSRTKEPFDVTIGD